MERGIEMVLHSVIIGLILYMLMIFVLKQKEEVAEKEYQRSVKKWDLVETRRERLEELDEKLQLTPRTDL